MKALTIDISGQPWMLVPGTCWVVTGPVACGKTWLAGQILHRLPNEAALVTFGGQAAASGADWAEARYHASIEYDFHTVAESLTYEAVNDINPFEVRPPERARRAAFARLRTWCEEALALGPLLDRWTVHLSNGEQRRVMLACAILRQTPVLVLDDPFAGLDPAMRAVLHKVLSALVKQGRTLVVAVRNEDEIPRCATHRLCLDAGRVVSQGPFTPARPKPSAMRFRKNPPSLPTPEVLAVRDLSLDLGGKTLFGGLNWSVHAGERWLIVGPNGCGKTTLLSLIVGDNPIAYACDIERFGKRPGPGVPLWSLRSRMAVVFPEGQAFADVTQTVEQTVYSGLFDKEGQRRRPTPALRKEAARLLVDLGLHERLRDALGTLSAGLVRLVLVVRALLAHPDLLLLDELCMNLEEAERKRLLRLLERLLDATPQLTVLYIAHRADHIPAGFDRVLRLGSET